MALWLKISFNAKPKAPFKVSVNFRYPSFIIGATSRYEECEKVEGPSAARAAVTNALCTLLKLHEVYGTF